MPFIGVRNVTLFYPQRQKKFRAHGKRFGRGLLKRGYTLQKLHPGVGMLENGAYNWPLGVSSWRNDKLHGAAVFSRPGASWLIPGAFLGRSCPPGSRLQGAGLMLHHSRAVAVDDRRGIGGQVPSWGRSRRRRWCIYVTSTAPRWGRDHVYFSASLGGRQPISIFGCVGTPIYFIYIGDTHTHTKVGD